MSPYVGVVEAAAYLRGLADGRAQTPPWATFAGFLTGLILGALAGIVLAAPYYLPG